MKRIPAFILCICILFSFCACGKQENTKTGVISLTDQAGREISLEKPAERIVSCYYISSYALLALGRKDSVVGIENKADTRPIYRKCAPEFLSLPGVGTMKACDTELIASLSPDLVILPAKLSDAAQILQTLGIPTLVVDPQSRESLFEMLELIGKACGAEKEAEKLKEYWETAEKKLSERLAGTERPRVLLCGNSSYLTAAPAGMYQNGLITNAGGENAAGTLSGTYWTEISYETMLALDPDAIVFPSGAGYHDEFFEDKQTAELSAVKNHRVYEMPSDFEEWDSPIPSGILGELWLASVLHPDRYSPTEFAADRNAFYQTFYGFTPEE